MGKDISIIIADNQYLVRQGLKFLLKKQPNLELLGEVTDEEELLDMLKGIKPDVVVMDYNQEGAFSTETVAKIKIISPLTNILIISADDHKETIYQVLEHGVNSFITKTCDEEEIIDAVKAASKKEKFFCTKVLDYLLEKSFPKSEDVAFCAPTPLSPREIEIVQLIAQGLIAKEIADRLCLSTHTIYTHRKNIMKKLQLNSASELMIYAVNHGIIDPST